MAVLSVLQDGRFVTCASPVFLLSEEENVLIFEIFEDAATTLKQRLGKAANYRLGSGEPFFGKLELLEPWRNTYLDLPPIRPKPTMLAVMTVHQVTASTIH